MSAAAPPSVRGDTTRTRILDATGVVLARRGPRKLSLTDIAAQAGVSRPTLYKYFGSKEELLLALAVHEKQRFGTGLAAALDGLTGAARLDRALRFVVEFQQDYPMRELVAIEPGFMIDQLEQALRTMRGSLVPLFEELPAAADEPDGPAGPADLADLVVRTALSHFLIPGDDAQLLRELRHVAGLTD
ncbi:MAG: TetR/AcrR family transcriptional regulator [Acidimicrobiia bacterium]